MSSSTRIVAVLVVAIILLTGCTTVRQEFTGSSAEQVWTAMVAVAQSPAYDDWTLVTNDVWVDESQKRIEVYRRLRRVLIRPLAEPHPEQRTWRFDIRLEQADPPEAALVSRGFEVPAHARIEGERYFADVLNLLGGFPSPPGEMHPQGAPATSPDEYVEPADRR